MTVKERNEISDLKLTERLHAITTEDPLPCEIGFWEGHRIIKENIYSLNIFRLMLRDVLTLLSIDGYSPENREKIRKSCNALDKYDGTGFIGSWEESPLGGALIPLWLTYFFRFKNYGIVSDIPRETRGLASNERSLLTGLGLSLYGACWGPLPRKGKEIYEMYANVYGEERMLFRFGYSNEEKDFELMLKALHSCGFYYEGRTEPLY